MRAGHYASGYKSGKERLLAEDATQASIVKAMEDFVAAAQNGDVVEQGWCNNAYAVSKVCPASPSSKSRLVKTHSAKHLLSTQSQTLDKLFKKFPNRFQN